MPGASGTTGRGTAMSFTGFVLATAAVIVLFRVFPEIDLWFQRFFWTEADGFFLKNSAFALFFYKGIRWATPIVGGILAVIILHGLLGSTPRTKRWLRPSIATLATLAIGAGLIVNVMLKDQWGRARPSQIAEFGGVMQFTPPFALAEQCVRNCSFVAGHPSVVFSLFALALFATRYRNLALAAVALGGALAGLGRIMQGGHFLSDVIFSGVVMFVAAWVIHRIVIALPLDRPLPRAGASPSARRAMSEVAALFRDIADVAIKKPEPGEPGHFEALGTQRLTQATLAVVVACAVAILWIDRPLALTLKAHAGGLVGLAHAIAAFGTSTMWLVAAAVIGIALWVASRRIANEALAAVYRTASQRALFFLVAVGGSGLFVNLLKIVFGRTRPRLLFSEDVYSFHFFRMGADFWSFPSGHTVTAAAVAAAVAVLWPRLMAPFIALTVLVALARVVATAHYLSDVLFSVYLGVFFTLGTKVWFERRGYRIFALGGAMNKDLHRRQPAE
jgi:lipid A 4'-phosphatase